MWPFRRRESDEVRMLRILINKVNQVMSEQDDAAAVLEGIKDRLGAVSDQLAKAKDEIIAASNDGDSVVSPRLRAAIDALSPVTDTLAGQAQGLDDLHADAQP